MSIEVLKKYQRICFLLMIVFLPIFPVVEKLQVSFIAGGLGRYLSFYPLIIGILLMLYRWKKYHDLFMEKNMKYYFFFYLILLIFISVHGIIIYPYYDEIHLNSFNHLERVFVVLSGYGFTNSISPIFFLIIFLFKKVILDVLWMFSITFFVYQIFRDDCHKAIACIKRGIMISLLFIFLYSLIEVFYLAGNGIARMILENITPYIHAVKTSHQWWPPLLWEGRLRSVFSEPSFLGIYFAFAVPFLWYEVCKSVNCRWKIFWSLIITGVGCLIFLTQSRSAIVIFYGELFLLIIYVVLQGSKRYLKLLIIVLLCNSISLLSANLFVKYYVSMPQSHNNVKIEQVNLLEDTVNSLKTSEYEPNNQSLSNHKSSNDSRYAVMKADWKVAVQYPILGVGPILKSRYIVEYFPPERKQNQEMKTWVKMQTKDGVIKAPVSIVSEYSNDLAMLGFVGTFVYLLPAIWVIIKLFILWREKKENLILGMVWIAFIGTCATGIASEFRISYWILLGIGLAMVHEYRLSGVLVKKDE